MDLNSFNIINDTTFYAIWAPEPIDADKDIHEEYFDIVNDNYSVNYTFHGEQMSFQGVSIKLNTVVKGKLTIPSSINGRKVVALTSNATYIGGRATKDDTLAQVTHIFFQKDEDGYTSIGIINDNTFYGCENLKYFEFAKGIYRIGNRAFSAVKNLAYVSEIGGTVSTIGDDAFSNAFKFNDNPHTLKLGSSIEFLGNTSFGNLNAVANNSLIIQLGSLEDKFSYVDFPNNHSSNLNSTWSILRKNEAKIISVIAFPENPNAEVYSSQDALVKALFGDISTFDPSKVDIITA